MNKILALNNILNKKQFEICMIKIAIFWKIKIIFNDFKH